MFHVSVDSDGGTLYIEVHFALMQCEGLVTDMHQLILFNHF